MSLAYSSEVLVLIGDNIDYIMKKFASEIANYDYDLIASSHIDKECD